MRTSPTQLLHFQLLITHGCVGCMYMCIKYMGKSNEGDGVIPKIIA